jgi:uncharacterized protein (DUF2236 family)
LIQKGKVLNYTASSTPSTRGYFSPQSSFWRVNRELVVILSGARAVIMELAHPLVAAGVANHSNFRRDSLGRLYRTIRMMIDANFGKPETAHQAVNRIHRCHKHVKGTLSEGVGPFPAETSYCADDPHLKMWVLATLIDSTLLAHDLFVKPLTWAEKEAYYRDGQRLGHLLGIPAQVIPATYHDFNAYIEAMVNGDTLTVSGTAREVAAALFAPPLGPALRIASFVGIGLLPARLRSEFNFSWDEKKEKRLRQLAAWSRKIRPLLPAIMCIQPEALIAEWRMKP